MLYLTYRLCPLKAADRTGWICPLKNKINALTGPSQLDTLQRVMRLEKHVDRNRIQEIALQIAGALGVFSFVYFFFGTEGDLIDSLLNSGFTAFAGGYASAFVLFAISKAKETSSQYNNPLMQGVQFAFFIVLFVGTFDLLLMRGIFFVKPFFSLLLTQSLEGTFWMCTDWVSGEEGAYCLDE